MIHAVMTQEILIVDDSNINREILSEMLGNEYIIHEAASGEECIDLLNQYGSGISLVLLDIIMPEMDGFEVLDYMAEHHWIDDIPVIMISSEDSASSIRKAYEFGVSDYISRPFDSRVVYQRVFNTIKLYAKQCRLISLVSERVYKKAYSHEKAMALILNGECGTFNPVLVECLKDIQNELAKGVE